MAEPRTCIRNLPKGAYFLDENQKLHQVTDNLISLKLSNGTVTRHHPCELVYEAHMGGGTIPFKTYNPAFNFVTYKTVS